VSPESSDPQRFGCDGRPTCGSDCYALGMVIYVGQCVHHDSPSFIHPRVLTCCRPFHHTFRCIPMSTILRGERPSKPFGTRSPGFSEIFLGSVQSCRSGSHSSWPTARRLLEHLSRARYTRRIPPSVSMAPASPIQIHPILCERPLQIHVWSLGTNNPTHSITCNPELSPGPHDTSHACRCWNECEQRTSRMR